MYKNYNMNQVVLSFDFTVEFEKRISLLRFMHSSRACQKKRLPSFCRKPAVQPIIHG